MRESWRWRVSRVATLLVVLVGHVAVIAALILRQSLPVGAPVVLRPLQLLVLQPQLMPRIRADDAVRRRGMSPAVPSIRLPVVDAPRLGLASPEGPSADGSATGVDWAAEARRALQAFEIRQHSRPPSNLSVAGEPGNDYWLRELLHAGDQLKTANGDWIIWTDANCFQIARSDPLTAAPLATSPEVTCLAAIAERHGDATLHR